MRSCREEDRTRVALAEFGDARTPPGEMWEAFADEATAQFHDRA
jgi:hypothetical protein